MIVFNIVELQFHGVCHLNLAGNKSTISLKTCNREFTRGFRTRVERILVSKSLSSVDDFMVCVSLGVVKSLVLVLNRPLLHYYTSI